MHISRKIMDILVILTLTIGVLVAFLILKFKFDKKQNTLREQFDQQRISLTTEKTKAEERAAMLESAFFQANQDLPVERTRLVELSAALASVQTELKNANQKLLEQKDDLLEIQSQFAAEFKNL